MDRAVLVIETDFSDSDFQIEWPEIAEIYTTSQFIITLKNREEYAGTIEGPRDSLRLITNEKGIVTVQIEDIVLLKGFEGTFKDRFFANIDLGFSLTKANNLRQFSTRSNIGYSERK
ncbi:MAG: hypothetical protein WBN11_10700 [Eudoraea sp.]|uniref:hypothetical protein n=1 Tax=Eudoraea sp. TaxID=1979955 RepID=UPI003C75A293